MGGSRVFEPVALVVIIEVCWFSKDSHCVERFLSHGQTQLDASRRRKNVLDTFRIEKATHSS